MHVELRRIYASWNDVTRSIFTTVNSAHVTLYAKFKELKWPPSPSTQVDMLNSTYSLIDDAFTSLYKLTLLYEIQGFPRLNESLKQERNIQN